MRAPIGQRDKLVTVHVGVDDKAPSGLPIIDWDSQPTFTVWMRREDVSGAERLASAQLQASVDTAWEMPFVPRMNPELYDVPKYRRLEFGGRMYDIQRAVLDHRQDGEHIRVWTLARSG